MGRATVVLNGGRCGEDTRLDAEAEEHKRFYTAIAITVVKVLCFLAALITLQFIIQAIGRSRGTRAEKSPEDDDASR